MGVHKLNIRLRNCFFGDPVLFQSASAFYASLVPKLAELGAVYAASDKTYKKGPDSQQLSAPVPFL